jgi:FkbM family methyltransferase
LASWTPPSTIEEKLKNALVPPKLYLRYKALKEYWRGEAEVRLLPFLVPPRRNAVDAGANKGAYTYFLARRAAHVWAFEPNPKMYDVLRRTVPANVTASRVALSNRSGTADFRIPQMAGGGYSNQGGSLSTAKVSSGYASVAVEAKPLDELGLTDVGFIKIDVEGFEAEVVEGARETIRRDRPVLLIEMEERYTKVPIERSLADIAALGYRGLFLEKGLLRPLDAFDPEAHHRAATKAYVFNFVFLPS